MKNSPMHNLFYISSENIQHDEIAVEGEKLHHLKNVLRKKAGDVIFITDGDGHRYKIRISKVTKSLIRASIIEKEHIKKNMVLDLELAFVPLKGWRNDFIIEKGTELGIKRFIIFLSKFSVITDLRQARFTHLKK